MCDKLPDLTKYKPHLFTTTALQQAKVNLTWDETDPRRNELVNKLKTNPKSEIDDCDLQKYVAFSSEDENSEGESKSSDDNEEENNLENGSRKNPINKYKELLQSIQKQEEEKANKDTELEISWGIGLQEKVKKSIDEKSKKNLTPFQKMMEKKKERMKEKQKLKKEMNEKKDDEETDSENESKRHAELELLLMDEEVDVKQHFNMKKIQEEETKSSKKKKKKNENEKSNNDTFMASY